VCCKELTPVEGLTLLLGQFAFSEARSKKTLAVTKKVRESPSFRLSQDSLVLAMVVDFPDRAAHDCKLHFIGSGRA
jgi:hypothetical protein